jgi:alkaline phosphatase
VATMEDVLDFDNAVAEAVAFYNANPNDTLIIVTGDHETGGMTVGHATTAYTEYYSRLTNQVCSFQQFGAVDFAAHKAAYTNGYDWTKANLTSGETDAVAFINLMATRFGLDYATLNDYQKEKLEDAYDKSMADANDNSAAENTYLYGGYEPAIVTITHILNERASVGWTSYSHTGVPVPVFAIGFDAYRFEGFYDNTDIAKHLAAAMRFSVTLPVEK